jgi:hypothetical protein
MLGKSTRHISITLLIGLLCMVEPAAPHTPAVTPQTRQISIVQDMAPVGLISGQTLRYAWANLNDPDPRKRIFEPLRIGVRLLAADESVIAQVGAEAVSAGRFQMFDFKRGLINLPGEAGTGRLQVRLEVTVIGRIKYSDIVLKKGMLEAFDDALEVIDDSSGSTSVSYSGGMNEIRLNDSSGNEHLNPESFQIITAGKDQLIGIIPGQALRLGAVNPLAPSQDGRDYKMLFAVAILNADGEVIAQSDELALEPGKSHSFEFKYADLHLAAEPGTGRLQVRAEIRRFFPGIPSRISQGMTDAAPAALEIVEINTGKTLLLVSQKPKEIVVVGSK